MPWADKPPFAPWIPVIVAAIPCAATIGGAYGCKRGLGEHCGNAAAHKVPNVEERHRDCRCDTLCSEVGTYCPERGAERAKRQNGGAIPGRDLLRTTYGPWLTDPSQPARRR